VQLPALRHPLSPAQRVRRQLRRISVNVSRRIRNRDYETSRWLTGRYQGPTEVERVLYVNLDSAQGRRADMERHLSGVGAPFERFRGIHGAQERDAYSAYLAARPPLPPSIRPSGEPVPYELTDGLVGCWLSHVHAIGHITTRDEGLYLVLEDDYHLPENWKARIAGLLSEIPDDWDILKLWSGSMNGKPNLRGVRVSKNLVKLGPALFTQQNLGMVSYLVRHHASHARRTHEAFENAPVMHADDALNYVLDDVNVYAPRHRIGTLSALGVFSTRDAADRGE
jgi:GR25 family glycosyltransferase involved in LPS biosynthesis